MSFHQPTVAPSLTWRVLTWLGSLTQVLEIARAMILTHHPDSLCHRRDAAMPSWKGRTAERLATLETAHVLLATIAEWEDCFGQKFFPRFAIRPRSP